MGCPAPAIVSILVLLPLSLRSPALARHAVPLERFIEVDVHALARRKRSAEIDARSYGPLICAEPEQLDRLGQALFDTDAVGVGVAEK